MNQLWKRDVTGFLADAEQPLLSVLGPTASGKTGFSIELAEYIASLGRTAEIINADSRQLYRYLDIGTAKIKPEEMRGVRHHLLDVLDPKEEATAGWYQEQARSVIRSLHEQQKVPILVGGSMLYISSITDELTMAPAHDEALRARLEAEYDADGGVSLFERLQEVDPETAESLHRNNKPRLIRAVEIYELLQAPKSQAIPHSELRSDEHSCAYDLLTFGMEWERSQLYERINARTDAMFREGWLEEVEDLLKQGYTADHPGMKSHGYREIIAYMEGSLDDLEALQALIATKTRQYAKRQLTWWRGDGRIRWLSLA